VGLNAVKPGAPYRVELRARKHVEVSLDQFLANRFGKRRVPPIKAIRERGQRRPIETLWDLTYTREEADDAKAILGPKAAAEGAKLVSVYLEIRADGRCITASPHRRHAPSAAVEGSWPQAQSRY
jgi:hypothetical protein